MCGKSFSQVVALAALAVLAAAPFGRGDDIEDRLLAKVRQRQADEGRELEREVTEALARAKSLAPEKARGLLRASRARLRDDRYLPAEARKRLLRQVEDRLDSVREKIAKAPRVAEVAGAAGVQVTPVVSADRRFVRVGLSGTFVAPSGLPVVSLSTTVSVPDRGTAVVGGSSSLAEGRHEYGPPGLSNVPYASRLFRNNAYGRQVRSYRVLLGVRIISLHEEDERLLGQAAAP
jgi:hypothetical protein